MRIYKYDDITGQRFGRWFVLSKSEKKCHSCTIWWCRCDCGTVKEVLYRYLKNGRSTSCRCYANELLVKMSTKHGCVSGGNKTPEYICWLQMIGRCHRTKHKMFNYYGGRGISVCDRWKLKGGFINFLKDMGVRPSINHSIDRLDNNGNYNKENCRWATKSQQSNNTRRNRVIIIDGERMTALDISKKFEINYSTVISRLNSGWSWEEVISKIKFKHRCQR